MEVRLQPSDTRNLIHKPCHLTEQFRNLGCNGLTSDKHLTRTCVTDCFGTADYFATLLPGYRNLSGYDGAWARIWERNRKILRRRKYF